MRIRTSGTNLASTALASTTATSIALNDAERASVQVVYSNVAPAAITFNGASGSVVVVADDTIVSAAHGYVTGLAVVASTAGTLPTGLSATTYYVIRVDANTIKLGSSLANAEAGTAVNITAVGVGNSTLTPSVASGNVAKLQESNDNTNWVDVASATVTIATSAATTLWNYTGNSRFLRVLYTPSAGQINLAIHSCLVTAT